MTSKPEYSRLLWPAVLTTVVLAAFANYGALLAGLGADLPLIAEVEAGRLALAAASCLALAWLSSRSLEVILTRVMGRAGRRPPRLLHQTITVLLFLTALVVVLSFVFDRSLVGVLTTSGVLVAVVGFALRNVIADIFSGLALGFEGPYRIGDWIETESGIRGRVMEINWRSTRLETRNQVHMVLPNGAIAQGRITNYSAPRPHYRVQLPIVLDFGIPVEQAKRVLLAGVSSAPKIRSTPSPDVRVEGYAERGIRYVVRYWLPSFADEVDCRDAVLSSIDRHLRIAAIAAPYGRERVILERDRRPSAGSPIGLAEALRRIPAFARLPREDREMVARAATRLSVPAGGGIEATDDRPKALLVVSEGLLAARDGAGHEMGMLGAGDMLWHGAAGEAVRPESSPGLATGTGAVLLRIELDGLQPVLARHPAFAAALEAAVERWRRLPAKAAEADPQVRPSAGAAKPGMLGRIRELLR